MLNSFKAECKAKGLRLTKQKIAIYEVLLKDHSHPTAEQIFARVKEFFPNISFATVYNNLHSFKEMGLIRELQCGGNRKHYEANMDPHHHVIDSQNGRILDVKLAPEDKIPLPKGIDPSAIKEIKVTYII